MYNQGKIMRRLLGRPTTDSPTSDSNLGPASSPIPQSFRPNASQNAAYATAPISCLDRSADGQFVVLGGRHILKTIQFDRLNIREGIDIRAAITSQQTSKSNSSSSTSDQLSIKDVKWAANQGGEPTILTACANGKIFQYNVSRLGSGISGLEVIQTREDSRQVNKLAINPHRNSWLLSGSQDGVVRCFDVKAPAANRNGQATFRSFQLFKGNAEGIRDVKWSPKDGMIFACATESGAVLKWDIRKANAPLLKINAHDGQRGATSISWHPDGEHLVSAGLDHKCHVWNLSKNADKKQKPKWTISAPAPVAAVSWRPALWSATARGRRAAQVAISYEDKRSGISSVHIWDFGRPTMPFKEIDRFEISPSALLWHDQDLLWTAGEDGLFTQCDVAFAPKKIDRQTLSSLDFSPRGDVLMLVEERVPPPRPRPTIVAPDMLPTSSYSSSPTGQSLSISRSDSDEDVVGSFLGPQRRTDRKQQHARSAQTLSTTPPSGPGIDEPVIPLDQAIGLTGNFKPQQVMAIGHVPAASKASVYQYLSTHYLEALEKELPLVQDAKPLNERVATIMEYYARAAENVSQFRLAQTWRILSYAIDLLLTRRSQYHLEIRMNRRKSAKSPSLKNRSESRSNLLESVASTQSKSGGEETPRKAPSITSVDSRQSLAKSLLAEEFDSESNVPTPLARPVKDDNPGQHQYIPGQILTPVEELDSFTLPPAFHPQRPGLRQRLDSVPFSVASEESQLSSTEGYDFYDLEAIEALPKAIDVPKKKEPLSLDFVGPRTPNSKKAMLTRYDSDESFAQMFSVSDASRQTAEIGSSGGSMRPATKTIGDVVGSNRSSEEEYESRIRGKQIQDTIHNSRHPINKAPERQDSGSLREIFMISQTTTYSDETEHSQDAPGEPPQQVSEQTPVQLKVTKPTSPRKTSNERLAQERPEERTSVTITETDFMPWPDDPPYPHPLSSEPSTKVPTPPLKPYDFLSRALAYEAKHSALNASAMILLLKPLVPDDVIDPYQAAAILRQHHHRLMSQKLFVEAALLRNLCVRDWPDGIDIWGDNYTSIFLPAQERVLVAYACSQCHKPRDIDRASKSPGPGIWKCERCKAIMGPCAICGHRDATQASLPPTPVAQGIAKSAALQDDMVLSTWWYCPGCSHGGHATCLQGWHSPVATTILGNGAYTSNAPGIEDSVFPETYSDGCCPMDGCGHACLPGKWRNETSAARTEELGRAVREQTRGSISTFKHSESRRVSNADSYIGSTPTVIGGVRSDSMEVSQSRAVDGVREALAMAGLSGGNLSTEEPGKLSRAAGGILSVLSSSPGRLSSLASGVESVRASERTERERRKSVKFARAPEERR